MEAQGGETPFSKVFFEDKLYPEFGKPD